MDGKRFVSKYEIQMDPEAPHAEKRLFTALALVRGSHIQATSLLDIGCSDGKYAVKIGEAIGASTIYGIDMNANALEKARMRGISTYSCDIDGGHLPFADNSIGFVYCTEVIEHIVNTDMLMIEILRVLQPRGYLLISTPNLGCWVNRIVLLIGWQPIYTEVSFIKHYGTPFGYTRGNPVGHVRVFTWPALKEFLNYKGFHLSKVKGYAALEHPLLRLVDSVISPISMSLATGLICLCKKRD